MRAPPPLNGAPLEHCVPRAEEKGEPMPSSDKSAPSSRGKNAGTVSTVCSQAVCCSRSSWSNIHRIYAPLTEALFTASQVLGKTKGAETRWNRDPHGKKVSAHAHQMLV